MKLPITFASQNEELLFVGLSILAGLLFISFVRILLLLRRGRKMAARSEKLEKQILDQQQTLLDIRSDSNAWRGEMQRQFDAFRADSAKRLEEAGGRSAGMNGQLEAVLDTHRRRVEELEESLEAARRIEAELPAAKARILELEKELAGSAVGTPNGTKGFSPQQLASLAAATKAVSGASSLPMLPSMEALQGLPGMDATKPICSTPDSLTQLQQRNSELQRALLLARRRKPADRAKSRTR